MCSRDAGPKDVINSLSPTRDHSSAGRDRANRSFPRQNRLHGRTNFLAVLTGHESKRRRGRWCEIVYLEIGEPGTSFGISITKKAGSAVRRNRLKRIIREYLRNHKNTWPENKMVVIRIKAAVDDEAGLLAELEDMLMNL